MFGTGKTSFRDYSIAPENVVQYMMLIAFSGG